MTSCFANRSFLQALREWDFCPNSSPWENDSHGGPDVTGVHLVGWLVDWFRVWGFFLGFFVVVVFID